MSFPELFAIAVALAMDAFAVSVCAGCALKRVTVVHFLRLSLTFGFFQFLMPVIGWALGLTVRGFIESWDHWIAFALLAWIGGNMIREALSGEEDEAEDAAIGAGLDTRNFFSWLSLPALMLWQSELLSRFLIPPFCLPAASSAPPRSAFPLRVWRWAAGSAPGTKSGRS